MNQSINIPINPVPASRPKVYRYGLIKYGASYTRYRADMEALLPTMGITKMTGPLALEASFFVQMPKSWSKKKKAEHDGLFCQKNYDLDNLEKALYDALNGIAYIDDSQIVRNSSEKVWAYEGRTSVDIYQIGA